MSTARAPLTHPHRIDYRDGVPDGASQLDARITRLWLHLVCDHADDATHLAWDAPVGDTEADLVGLVDLHQELHERHDRYLSVVDAARRVLDIERVGHHAGPGVRGEAFEQLHRAVVQFDARRCEADR